MAPLCRRQAIGCPILRSYIAKGGNTQTSAQPLSAIYTGSVISTSTYDVVNDGVNAYLYDAEGRICAVNTGSGLVGYLYDAAGNRVAKGSISTMSCDISLNTNGVPTNGFTQTAGYVVGPSGEQLTEVDGSGNWRHTNVYAGGKLIGTYDGNVSSPTLHFHFDDPLGTRRAQANAAGVLEATYQSLPFGDGYIASGTVSDPTENHFTGKERDAESGNDYFGARYYNSATGRFLSPDWSAKSDDPVPYAKLEYPQSLNLYAYVVNDPMSKVDLDGHAGSCKENPALCKAELDAVHDGGTMADGRAAYEQGHYAPVVIRNGKAYEGKLCGDHECVAYVKEAGGFNTPTAQWKAGPSVLDFKDKGLPTGTAIMLADKDGHYPKGSSPKHAAEFMGFTPDGGIMVRDQWAARYDKNGVETRHDQPVHTRTLTDNHGRGNPVADASQYHLLMLPVTK